MSSHLSLLASIIKAICHFMTTNNALEQHKIGISEQLLSKGSTGDHKDDPKAFTNLLLSYICLPRTYYHIISTLIAEDLKFSGDLFSVGRPSDNEISDALK